MADDTNPKQGDSVWTFLRKILIKLNNLDIHIDPGDINIGSVEIKDAGSATLATVRTTTALVGDAGLVVRDPDVNANTDAIAVSVAEIDGKADAAITAVQLTAATTGLTNDAVITNPATSGTVISFLKGLLTELISIVTNTGNTATSTATTATNTGTIATNTGSTKTNLDALAANLAVGDNVADAGNPLEVGGAAADPASLPAAATATRRVRFLTDLSRRLLTWTWAQGTVADNATDGDNPVKVGAQATDPRSLPAATTTGKRANVLVDLNRQLLTVAGGLTSIIKVSPTISSSPAYTAGDAVGGKQTLSNVFRVSGGTAVLESITVNDRANQKATLEIYVFDSDPTNATITDNAALVFSTDDLKILARIEVGAADYVTQNSKAVATIKGIGVALQGNATANLYVAVATTSTPTYSATSDLQFTYGFLQD